MDLEDTSSFDLHRLPSGALFEIFQYCKPLDLLSLSRVNKSLRTRLMSKTLSSVWRDSLHAFFSTSRIPKCPTDLNEVQWMRLLLTKECTICGTEASYASVDWNLRLRTCTNCFQGYYLHSSDIQEEYPNCYQRILEVIPFSCFGDTDNVEHSRLYYTLDVHITAELLEAYDERIEYGDDLARAELQKLVHRRKLEIEDMIEFGSEMHEWEASQNSPRLSEHTAFSPTSPQTPFNAFPRHDSPIQCDLPYVDEDTTYVNGPAELTSPFKQKDQRISERAKTGYQRFLSPKVAKLPARTFFPPPASVASWTEYTSFLSDHSSDSREAADTILSQLILSHSNQRHIELVSQISRAGGRSSDAPCTLANAQKILPLAISVFRCSRGIIGQGPALHWIDESLGMHSCSDRAGKAGRGRYHAVPHWWPSECLQFDLKTCKAVGAIVQAAGMDPATTTVWQMDVLEERFVCGECPEGEPTVVRNWRSAALHSGKHHKQNWTIVSDPEVREAIKLEGDNTNDSPRYVCQHCPESSLFGWQDLHTHIEKQHLVPFDDSAWDPVNSIPPNPVSFTEPHYPTFPKLEDVKKPESLRVWCTHCRAMPVTDRAGESMTRDEFPEHMKNTHYCKTVAYDDWTTFDVDGKAYETAEPTAEQEETSPATELYLEQLEPRSPLSFTRGPHQSRVDSQHLNEGLNVQQLHIIPQQHQPFIPTAFDFLHPSEMPFSDPQQQAAMMMGLAMGLNVGMGVGFGGMPNAPVPPTLVGGSVQEPVMIGTSGEHGGSEQQPRTTTRGCKAAGDRPDHGRRWDELDSHASAWRNFKKRSGKGKGKKKN